MKLKHFLISCVVAITFSQTAQANPTTIAWVESYLSGLTTVAADFTQAAPDGTLATGKFLLKRPKKMRWEYTPPNPILMVTRGSYLTYYDKKLEQVSDIPLEDTLLRVLSQPNVSFAKSGISISNLQEAPGFVRISLTQKEQPENGALTLEFSGSPMHMHTMYITDATAQTTAVSLSNTQYGVPLEDELFTFKDPRVGGRNKHRF